MYSVWVARHYTVWLEELEKLKREKICRGRCDDLTSKIILLLEQRNILKYFKVLGSEILSISIEYINIGRSFLSLNKTRHEFAVIKTILLSENKNAF